MTPESLVWLGGVAVAFVGLRAILGWWLRPGAVRVETIAATSATSRVLAVVAHGISGRSSVSGLVGLIRSTFPDADCAVLSYDSRPYGNSDPFHAANVLELEVNRLVQSGAYESIILVGHSAGGAILRKMFVWAHGQEEDRLRFGARGRRSWVDRIERLVMLAGINRGWSVDVRPANMSLANYFFFKTAMRIARPLGIARFTRAIYRGMPFVADTRVQWLRVARSQAVFDGRAQFPQAIQLIGDQDDIVSKADGADLLASRGTVFKTLPQTTHRDIAAVVADATHPETAVRARCIVQALQGDLRGLEPDLPDPRVPVEQREIVRVVYLLHGIRDYGEWTEVLRRELEARFATNGEQCVVTNLKYGYFPLLPFIVYGDRQRNVCLFMDEYTENLARFPNAHCVDFVGHSNGTYILASALIRYSTPRVRRVLFAGSVVPKHFPWTELIAAGRVERVVNIAATADWVVAIFPKLFEQIADWLKRQPTRGWLDIGAAGFRGFNDAGEPGGSIQNIKFTEGPHSAGVDVSVRAKLDAIAAFVIDGNVNALIATFHTTSRPRKIWDVASNLSYLLWILLLGVAFAGGWWVGTTWGPVALAAYVLLLFALLHSL